ncbi:4Fe-4S dicluster domain-containing protein [Adlercreutzia sp. R25]|uniref:4Fe-4S dicluster domain-containing protein n=1 Tax=Adlercreutzia shanghongiae TaxID=3111773 RepID=A0ABU6IX62_9ACTN|nr:MULTISPECIES: 4Fe-4S dicluster domain-containing protein [unclassified Adlercreutzia]MEC4272662.1 4Fe-4S dicluster domain-containing protein [Adlercreutzia sp. R25]MEC4294437.1 4Fe-4S dicluster domain-containing protein [Adlercreutzia sp. R22]
MTQQGLLIDYEFCTGCHACEVACKVEKGLAEGEFGIKLTEIGPWKLDGSKKWEWDFVPMPTQRCDLCHDRTEAGKVPACVHHCQSLVMEYGPVEELAKKATKSRVVIFTVEA